MRKLPAVVALTAALALTATACQDGASPAPDKQLRVATSTSTTIAPFPPPVAWNPSPNEVEPQLKQAAADTLTALLTYDSGGGIVDAARARLAGAPADASVADKVVSLLDPDARAAADVIYPQMGGLAGNRASAMVVTRLRWDRAEGGRSEVRTIDVRLVRRGGAWRVEDIASLGGDPVPVPDALPEPARRVLEHPRIELPDSARWDIAAGRVTDAVLVTLATIGDAHDVKVAVLSSGHPIEVFGSAHTSNHIPGRAVDIWWLDGLVVDQRAATGPLRALLERLLAGGVTELGAPFDVDGARGANFANLVHQDHLHVGYDRE